jgi:site-specific DNA-adenine methylase
VFSYYGSKSRIAAKYPVPLHQIIIEPFAGSARYALLHQEQHNVILVEKNPIIHRLWQWLQTVDPQAIRDLPTLAPQDPIPHNYGHDARVLMGFVYNRGSHSPKNFAGNMGPVADGWGGKKLLLDRLPLIRNWTVILGDYTAAPDVEATWYVDPPYIGQTLYPVGRDLDYDALARWCYRRKGQLIVCENDTATWLPFSPLLEQTNTQSKGSSLRREGLFYREKTR